MIRLSKASSGQPTGCIAFLLVCVGYGILSVIQPGEYGRFTWIALAFLMLPALIGAIVGNRAGDGSTAGLFRQAFWPTGIAMFGYTAINLIVLRSRFSAGGSSGQI